MKYFLMLVFFVSIGCDNFQETKMFFTSDKSVYVDGDTIKLSINITSKKDKKIRFYKNLKNLIISSTLRFTKRVNGELSETFKVNGLEEEKKIKDEVDIDTFVISESKPFVKTLNGLLIENENNFVIDFREYGLKITIDKESYFKSNSFGFTGLCMPVNASFSDAYEDFVNFYPIKLERKK